MLGDDDKDTLATMNNMGVILKNMKDYEGALAYYQEALRVKEKVQGKTHPDTLKTILNMAITYEVGLKNFVKAEQMYRQALDGFERSLGKEHRDTKLCARHFASLLAAGQVTKKKYDVVKVVGSAGDVSVPAGLTVKAHAFTGSARAAIEGAGGKCVELSKTTQEPVEA